MHLSLSMHFKKCVLTFIPMLRFNFQFKQRFLLDVDIVHKGTDSHKHLLFQRGGLGVEEKESTCYVWATLWWP